MGVVIAVIVIVVVLGLLGFALSVRIVRQYEQGVLFRLAASHRDLRGSKKELQPWEQMSRGRKKDQALVIIVGEHDSDEQDVLAITNALRPHGTGKEGAYFAGPSRMAGVTVYLVGPVTDIKALADEIKVGKITEVDVKRNLLKMTVAPVPQPDKAADAGPPSKGT